MLDKLVDFYDNWSKGARAKDLEQLAREFNFRYEKRVEFGSQPSDIKSFEVFSKKGLKRFMGVMETDLEKCKGTVRFYDYIRTKDLETFSKSIVEVYCEDVRTDYFKIEPKGFFTRTKYLFKSKAKIQPRFKEFHKQFFIHTESREVQYLLNRKVLDLMLDFPKLQMEARGHCFVFYYNNSKEIPIGDVMPLIDFAEEVVNQLGTGEDEGYV